MGFKAISALSSAHCSRLILSTDCPEIQHEAQRFGVDVPFTRPAELAADDAPSSAVIQHAIDWIEENTNENYDAVALLEPSSPFTRSFDYDNAIEMMLARRANAVVGMRAVEPNTVFVGTMDQHGRISNIIDKMAMLSSVRRQDLPQEYTMNGALYVFRWDYFKQHKNIYHDRQSVYGYEMPAQYSIEIDSQSDLDLARLMVETGQIDMSHWRRDQVMRKEAA